MNSNRGGPRGGGGGGGGRGRGTGQGSGGGRGTGPTRGPGDFRVVNGPQQAAEERERIQRQRAQDEREERERIEKERHARNLDAARKKYQQMEQARKRQVKDNSPSRSRSHQADPPGAPPSLNYPSGYQLSPLERMDEDLARRGLIPPRNRDNRRRGGGGDIVDITDDDEELQRALAESLKDSSNPPPVYHDVDAGASPDVGYGGIDEEDRDLQRALMMSAAEPAPTSSTSQPTPASHTVTYSTPNSRTTHTTYTSPTGHSTHTTYATSTTHSYPGTHTTSTTHSYQQSFTTQAQQPHSQLQPHGPIVHDVDGDVDMDLTSDPELQDALMRSLEQPPQTETQTARSNTHARIFGDNVGHAAQEPPRVYGVEDDDDETEDDAELQDALRLSREVIDVDQNGGSAGDFGGQVEDYPSPPATTAAAAGPIITDADAGVEGGEGMGEDEDMELQRALMQSLNPNASPPPAAEPARVARRPPPRVAQPPEDPAVANARRIRNEQDWAYKQSLAEDMEKERKANEEAEKARIQKEQEEQETKRKEMEETARRDNRDKAGSLLPPEPKEGQGITLGIRMPNGTRYMRRFNPTDTLKDLRNFIESKANESNLAQDYEITSDFPKKTFHDLPLENTLSEAGISGRMLLNLLEK